MKLIEIKTTCDNKEYCERISDLIISKRLAACIQTTTINSVYRWNSKIDNSAEYLISIKTIETKAEEIFKLIKSTHPYETPQLYYVPVEFADENYFNWIKEAL